jgi:hypothetical protein
MATKKKSLTKVFIKAGKSVIKKADGTNKTEDQYIVISEDLAKFIGAQYSLKPPEDKKIIIKNGKLKGRVITRSQSVAIAGRRYELGYRSTAVVKKGAKRTESPIKWIPIHIPVGLTLREFIKVVTKFSKKPAFLRTPSGVSTAFVNA